MAKYMLTFFGGNLALRYDNLEKAEKEALERHRAAWGEWMSDLLQNGQLEVGYPLMAEGMKVYRGGSEDYRFQQDTAGGFIVINAQSIDQAAEIAQKSPINTNGGYVLVRPCGAV